MSDKKPVELPEGVFIVKPPLFVRLIKILRSGSMVFSVESENAIDGSADKSK